MVQAFGHQQLVINCCAVAGLTVAHWVGTSSAATVFNKAQCWDQGTKTWALLRKMEEMGRGGGRGLSVAPLYFTSNQTNSRHVT